MIEDEPTQLGPRPTRRELRLQRRPRRLERLVGWLGYGLSVCVVVTMAAWLAVRGGSATPEPATVDAETATTASTTGVQPVASTSAPNTSPPALPATVAATVPTAPPTTTTTAPLVAAAVTPTP